MPRMLQKPGLWSLLLFVLVHLPAHAQGFKVTAGNAVNLGSSWAEITTAAVGPGENRFCPDGRLFFADGYAVLATDLNGQAVVWPRGFPNPRGFEYQETFPPHVIYDSHIVKLKDGSLVFTTEAITWNDNVSPKPAWWSQTAEFALKEQKHPGGRGIIYVYRSADCGRTWNRAADIDAATLTVTSPSGVPTKGLCGTPRLIQEFKMVDVNMFGKKMQVSQQVKTSNGGGWDGHYLYADPYNGNLFLSTPCVFGTGINQERFLALLLMSPDRGGSWKVIGQLDTVNDWADAWRMPISSLPSGHVAFGYLNWKLDQLKVAILFPPYPPVDLTAKAQILATRSPGELGPGAPVNTNVTSYPTLVRNPGKGFLVTTADWRPSDSGTKLAHRFFDVPVLALKLPGANKERPVIEAPGLADMIHGTLIDGTPSTDLHLFYWVERTPSVMSADGEFQNAFRVKFQVFKGNTAILKQPGTLTIANGNPYAYRADAFIGDYMGGASYAGRDGSQHFVAAWSEQGVLRFNTISLTPQVLTANAPTLVDVQITAQPVPVQKLVKQVPAAEAPTPARRSPTP